MVLEHLVDRMKGYHGWEGGRGSEVTWGEFSGYFSCI